MKKSERKITKNIVYPQKAYIAYILVVRNQNSRFFLPFNEVFTEIDQIKPFTRLFIGQSSDADTFIPPAPIVFPIDLKEKVPLKAAFREEPTDELTRTDRINNFLKPLQNYRFQKLLVTPVKIKGNTLITATYCFGIQAKLAEINFFMSNYFLSLDESAGHGAVYNFANPFRLDLETDEIIKITDSLPTLVN